MLSCVDVRWALALRSRRKHFADEQILVMPPAGPVMIDGSHGEGGGQIVRTAVALSAITGRPLRIERIRAGRRRPGLAAQHVTAVRAAASVCSASLDGDSLGSQVLELSPRSCVCSGQYTFDVGVARAGGSAGAATLVVQTVLVPLALAVGASTVTVHGGTHVAHAPPADYLREVWSQWLRTMGFGLDLELVRVGWYPVGHGELRARIAGATLPSPLDGRDRGRLVRISGRVLTSRLPPHVGERMRRQAIAGLGSCGAPVDILVEDAEAACSGAGIFLVAEYEHARAGSSAIGERGRAAEVVAEEALQELLAHHRSGSAIDAHMADQLLVPAAVASRPSTLEVGGTTRHLRTNAWVIEQFGLARVRIDKTGIGERVVVEPFA